MLKGVYFKDKGFMEAKKGCHPSWCWSSILTGRDLLEENIAWKVGNGDDINLWHDKWVVGIKGLKLSCERIPDELFQQKVSSIIDDQPKRWNLGSIEQHVNLVEKEAILAITLPEAEKEECVVWPANKSGVYIWLKVGTKSFILPEPLVLLVLLPPTTLIADCGKLLGIFLLSQRSRVFYGKPSPTLSPL